MALGSRTLLVACLTLMAACSSVHAGATETIVTCDRSKLPTAWSTRDWSDFLVEFGRLECNSLDVMVTITAWNTETERQDLTFPERIKKLSGIKLVASTDASGNQRRLSIDFPGVEESSGIIEILVRSIL